MLLHNRRRKGQNSYPLEQLFQAHCVAFVSMTVCSAHISHQLPNRHTRVGFFFNGIKTHDTYLLAQMAAVEVNTVKRGGEGRTSRRQQRISFPKTKLLEELLLT